MVFIRNMYVAVNQKRFNVYHDRVVVSCKQLVLVHFTWADHKEVININVLDCHSDRNWILSIYV